MKILQVVWSLPEPSKVVVLLNVRSFPCCIYLIVTECRAVFCKSLRTAQTSDPAIITIIWCHTAILLRYSDKNIIIKRCGMVQFRVRMRPFNVSCELRGEGGREGGRVVVNVEQLSSQSRPVLLARYFAYFNCWGKLPCKG